jgi:hypothetical protein
MDDSGERRPAIVRNRESFMSIKSDKWIRRMAGDTG